VKKNLRGLQYPIQQSKFASEPAILAIFSSSDRIGSLLRLVLVFHRQQDLACAATATRTAQKVSAIRFSLG
jgi:hypothetical protein